MIDCCRPLEPLGLLEPLEPLEPSGPLNPLEPSAQTDEAKQTGPNRWGQTDGPTADKLSVCERQSERESEADTDEIYQLVCLLTSGRPRLVTTDDDDDHHMTTPLLLLSMIGQWWSSCHRLIADNNNSALLLLYPIVAPIIPNWWQS